ncbi:HmuY family protein [Mesonia aestuariivivens]|uniref:HmuY family protein n=1 Tax=Mesonia aestuariivivens TaxID=2796128 RepID=A0ABS6W1S4_9FLAO|nr:HmuY family protein [Mesonia aestuariivivens]MBW2961803.1 HmuY family protein [Mesonia aestuariivivens]
MKTKLFLTALITSIFSLNAQQAVDLSMGVDYEKEIFYDFSTNNSQTFTASNWEIAFLRNSMMNMAIRINDGIGIQVFEASNDSNHWSTIGDPVTNISNWTELFNSDTSWIDGAFQQGSATYGWGEYAGPPNHEVYGTVIFVLKYQDEDNDDSNNIYRKLFIEEYLGGYTFKYATWDDDNETWSADITETVVNTSNPNNIFNYYNFTTEAEVVAEPAATEWDLKFTQFTTDYPSDGTTIKYVVTGALQNPNVTIAENVEVNGTGDPNDQTYLEEISTVGYDWKSFDMSTFSYSVEPDLYYYVKDAENNVYRLHFTSFEGGSTGNLSFNAEDVTSQMSTTTFDNGDSFGFYPNPAKNEIELLY